MAHLFCFGFGYCATVLSRRLLARGWTVTGTCREADKAAALVEQGVDAVLFDGMSASPDVTAALKTATHILVSIAPDADGDAVLVHHGGDIAALGDQIEWIGYLSATGVYGDRGGDWVDEESALAPTTNRAAAGSTPNGTGSSTARSPASRSTCSACRASTAPAATSSSPSSTAPRGG